MRRTRILWHIFSPMILVILITVTGVSFFASQFLFNLSAAATESDLRVRAGLVASQMEQYLIEKNFHKLNEISQNVAKKSEAHVTVILPDGQVIIDSQAEVGHMDNQADREEVVAALEGHIGIANRYDRTLHKDLIYAAVPVFSPVPTDIKHVAGIVRLSIPLPPLSELIRDISLRIVIGSFALALLATLITLFVSRRISRPLEDMQAIAERFSQHDFRHKIAASDKGISREVAGLAESMNHMAGELSERMETVTRQKNELETIFRSMVEGVLVIDSQERIEQVNQAAQTLLNLEDRGIGRPMVESVRNADLLKFVREIRQSSAPITRDLVFGYGDEERFFHASATPRFDSQGQRNGALIVLNDVTRLRRLENMRREFVANVSHELKTPITSIKGFVETICDGNAGSPEEVNHFMKIILKQSNRLNAIVEDLLALSRIEQEEEQCEIELQKGLLRPVLHNCIESTALRAMEKYIDIKLDCSGDINATMNAHLLEQAVTNLLVNAIKYSHERSMVELRARQEKDSVLIQVEDKGCGIAKEHLPRLFERFYRSDKARSRKLGGTGLGLAIVKHIVQAHRGTVEVESELGRGSVFTIRIPVT